MSSSFSIFTARAKEAMGVVKRSVDEDVENATIKLALLERDSVLLRKTLLMSSEFLTSSAPRARAGMVDLMSSLGEMLVLGGTHYKTFAAVHAELDGPASVKLSEAFAKAVLAPCDEWIASIAELRVLLADLDKARVVYDHYKLKLTGLQDEKRALQQKGKIPAKDFEEKLARNAEKLKEGEVAYLDKRDSSLGQLLLAFDESGHKLDHILLRLMQYEKAVFEDGLKHCSGGAWDSTIAQLTAMGKDRRLAAQSGDRLASCISRVREAREAGESIPFHAPSSATAPTSSGVAAAARGATTSGRFAAAEPEEAAAPSASLSSFLSGDVPAAAPAKQRRAANPFGADFSADLGGSDAAAVASPPPPALPPRAPAGNPFGTRSRSASATAAPAVSAPVAVPITSAAVGAKVATNPFGDAASWDAFPEPSAQAAPPSNASASTTAVQPVFDPFGFARVMLGLGLAELMGDTADASSGGPAAASARAGVGARPFQSTMKVFGESSSIGSSSTLVSRDASTLGSSRSGLSAVAAAPSLISALPPSPGFSYTKVFSEPLPLSRPEDVSPLRGVKRSRSSLPKGSPFARFGCFAPGASSGGGASTTMPPPPPRVLAAVASGAAAATTRAEGEEANALTGGSAGVGAGAGTEQQSSSSKRRQRKKIRRGSSAPSIAGVDAAIGAEAVATDGNANEIAAAIPQPPPADAAASANSVTREETGTADAPAVNRKEARHLKRLWKLEQAAKAASVSASATVGIVNDAKEGEGVGRPAPKAKAEDDAVEVPKAEDDAVAVPKAKDDAVAVPKVEDDAVAVSKAEDDAVAVPKAEDDAVAVPKAEDDAIAVPLMAAAAADLSPPPDLTTLPPVESVTIANTSVVSIVPELIPASASATLGPTPSASTNSAPPFGSLSDLIKSLSDAQYDYLRESGALGLASVKKAISLPRADERLFRNVLPDLVHHGIVRED